MKLLILLLSFCSLFIAAPVSATDKIVAVINNDIITQSQLSQQARLARQQAAAMQQPAPTTERVLDQMINMQLQLQLAKSMGITVSDEAVEQAIESIAQRNNLMPSQLNEALQKEGINPTRYRKDTREQLILSQLHQRVIANKIKVSDEDVEKQLQTRAVQKSQRPTEYHLTDIILPTRKDAEETVAHLRAGKKFEELPFIKAQGIEALEGGDMGWRKLKEIPELFIPYVKDMRPGQLSDIIEAPNGFHVLHMIDMKGELPAQQQRSLTETEARHILLRNSVLTKPSDLQLRLASLRRELEHGADFSTLAAQYSQDAQSAPKGGDLGWIRA
ncbi:MAG: peptidylprolyl isomerase, partial [Gammaproteobacteria bacterium]